MGLTILLLVSFLATEPKNSRVADLNGVWIADLARCNFRASPQPSQLLLSVARDHGHLEVTEVHSDEVGKSVVQRRFLLRSRPQASKVEVGTARTAGRTTILRHSGQLEEWQLSIDGNLLIVNRWLATAADPARQTLILRRSTVLPVMEAPPTDYVKPLQRRQG